MVKKTYGQELLDHRKKNLEVEDDVIEYRRVIEKDIAKQLHETALNAKSQPLYRNKDFYIVMMTRLEKIGSVPRTFIFARRSCPTPVYNQSVWKFMHTTDTLEYLWSVPDQVLYWHIFNNQAQYIHDKECATLAKFVILMESGELLTWVKKENGELKDAVIKLQKESEICTTKKT